MKETFDCPNCGQKNNIEWDTNETQRTIPCLGCYGEEWTPAQPDENTMVMDAQKGKMVYTRMASDAVKQTHGVKLKCQKGQAPSCEAVNG